MNRLAAFVNSKEITSKTDINLVDLHHNKIILVKKSFFYVHCNGVCISTLFSLSYKPDVFLECYLPVIIYITVLFRYSKSVGSLSILKLQRYFTKRRYSMKTDYLVHME